jgi:hypothetical protein
MKKLIALLLMFFNACAFGYGDSTHGQSGAASVSRQQNKAIQQSQKRQKKTLKVLKTQQHKQQKQLQQRQYKSAQKQRQ